MVYGSHARVLAALGGLRPKTVLELGGGRYSTRLFLSRLVFPNLEQLVTVEPDPHWQTLAASGDSRHTITEQWDSLDYDLVFVDDQLTTAGRVQTIEQVAERRPDAVVVVHDFQKPEYQQAAIFDYVVAVTTRMPWTGVMWNEAARYRGERIHRLLARA